MLESQNTFLDISSETLNCFRTPKFPLSRHSSIGFHPVKASRLNKLFHREASHRPNQPNHLLQSNTSDLIKESNLTRLSHNLCKVLFEKCLNSLYRNTRRLDSKKTNFPGYFYPSTKNTTQPKRILSNDNCQILSLDNTKTKPHKMALQTNLFCTMQNNIANTTLDLKKKLLFNLRS